MRKTFRKRSLALSKGGWSAMHVYVKWSAFGGWILQGFTVYPVTVGDGAPTSRRLSVGFGDNRDLRYWQVWG